MVIVKFMPHLRLSTALVIVVTLCLNVAVSAKANEAKQQQIEELIKQLGDDSFLVRERAAKELVTRGMQTKAALFVGMNSEDLEIAWRCRRLWCDVRIDKGWRQVREVVGDSTQSRKLFDKMFLAAPKVWYELSETTRSADVVFEEAKGRLQEQLKEKQVDDWEGALANLLYFGVCAKTQFPEKELARLDDLLSTGRSQQVLADCEPLRTLLEEWTIVTNTDGPAFDRLLIALRDRRPQAVEIARELLREEESPAKQRQYALLALLDSKSSEDEELVEHALDDSSALDVLFSKGLVIKSQLRDIALAVRITRRGQNPVDFGFIYLRLDDSTIYSPSSLGFKDSAERDEAFEKWSAYASRQVSEGSQ